MKTIFFNIFCVVVTALCVGNAFAQDVLVADNTHIQQNKVVKEALDDAIGNLSEKLNSNTSEPQLSVEAVEGILKETDKILSDAVGRQTLFAKTRDVGDVKDSDSLNNTPVRLARLRILNKITGHNEEKIVETGVELEYGTLSVKLYDCVYIQPARRVDAVALLEVMEKAPEDFVNMSLVGRELEVGKKIFFGWMVKSAPAISSMEHPVYDITLKGCGV